MNAAEVILRPWRSRQFEAVESRFATWCTGNDRLPDGSWALAAFQPGLFATFRTSSAPKDERDELDDWRTARPHSLAEAVAEATYWRALAAAATEDAAAASGSRRAAEELAAKRLARAAARLKEEEAQAPSCPAWDEANLRLKIDQHRPVDEIRSAFQAAQQRHPSYQQIYLEMARVEAPKGPDLEKFDRFALDVTAATRQTEGNTMYARLYVALQDYCGCGPEVLGPQGWLMLRASFIELLSRYPNSLALRNRYANFACRVGDRDSFLRERGLIGGFANPADWSPPFSIEECDRRYATPKT